MLFTYSVGFHPDPGSQKCPYESLSKLQEAFFLCGSGSETLLQRHISDKCCVSRYVHNLQFTGLIPNKLDRGIFKQVRTNVPNKYKYILIYLKTLFLEKTIISMRYKSSETIFLHIKLNHKLLSVFRKKYRRQRRQSKPPKSRANNSTRKILLSSFYAILPVISINCYILAVLVTAPRLGLVQSAIQRSQKTPKV